MSRALAPTASATPFVALDEGDARRLTDEVKSDAATLWQKLLMLHEGGAHVALGYDSWHAYCSAEFGFGKSHAYRLLDAGRVHELVPQLGNEAQARELAPLLREDDAEVIEVVRELRAEYGADQVTAKRVKQVVGRRLERIQRERARVENAVAARAAMPALPPSLDLREGDFREVLAHVRDVDLVFTDPPYLAEYMPIYSDLSAWAARALKPGGVLVAYSGQYHLPEAIARLSEHLDYVWQAVLLQPQKHTLVHHRQIHVRYKPLLIFSKGGYEPTTWIQDLVTAGPRTKESVAHHKWQQDAEAARYYIRRLTEPGALVADPFLGSGTFAKVAYELGRSVVGAELDPVAYATSLTRIAAG